MPGKNMNRSPCYTSVLSTHFRRFGSVEIRGPEMEFMCPDFCFIRHSIVDVTLVVCIKHSDHYPSLGDSLSKQGETGCFPLAPGLDSCVF